MKIAFIAPYKKMADIFNEVCYEIDKNIPTFIGDLEEGADIAVQLEEEGYDVIISRGGTAIAIKSKVTALPVVEVQVSGYDLIRTLYQARQETDKIAVAGFNPFTYGLEGLEKILGIDLKILTLRGEWYDQTDFIETRLEEIKEQGYNYLVGDNISVRIARKIGMNTLLIRSGKEALAQSILESERIAQVRKKEMEKAKRIKSIIDFAYEGIISIDKNGDIQTFNPASEKIFNKKAYKVIGKDIREVLPEMDLLKTVQSGYREQEKVWIINDIKIVANIIPIEVNEEVLGVVATFQKASRIQRMEKKIRDKLYVKGYTADNTFEDIIGESKVISQAKDEARDYARVDLPLLVYGETGTGKELFAQAIHNDSHRRNKPFVAFNCAALPEKLLESELFGYVKGAFTGASEKGKEGLFEQAHQGTIFLDEIGEISRGIQARLLRVFQERKIRRLGDNKLTPIDVRIMLATNKSLSDLVEKKEFREDLYYRINVLNLNLPPLRERREDIPLLVNFFINKASNRINKLVRGISDDGMRLLQRYDWPGNVRQLENVIEKLVVRTRKNYIMTNLVRQTINSIQGIPTDSERKFIDNISKQIINIPANETLAAMERIIIDKVIKDEDGNKTAAARRLGIGRTTLWRKMQ